MSSVDAEQNKLKKRNRKTAFWLIFWVVLVVVYVFLKQSGLIVL